MSGIVENLLDSLERAISTLRARSEMSARADVENLLRVRRVLESLDPDEVEVLLEEDDEEE